MTRTQILIPVVGFSAVALAANSSFAFIDWPGGGTAGYPSDPPDRIHHFEEEAVVGNQYMAVQLDLNGTVYDLYFPSAGFRNGSGTANEGYHGPEEFIGGPFGCGNADARNEANGQMNVIAGMAGIAVNPGSNNTIYWMKNAASTGTGVGSFGYSDHFQSYVNDNNVLFSSNRFTGGGANIKVEQYDFCPTPNALPVVTDGTRTNYAVYVKRYRLTNLEGSARHIGFFFDANYNIKGDNAYDAGYVDTHNSMVFFDNVNRTVTGSGCGPDGFGGTASTEYNPRTTASYDKTLPVYLAT